MLISPIYAICNYVDRQATFEPLQIRFCTVFNWIETMCGKSHTFILRCSSFDVSRSIRRVHSVVNLLPQVVFFFPYSSDDELFALAYRARIEADSPINRRRVIDFLMSD